MNRPARPARASRAFTPPTEAEVADYAAALGMADPPALARQFIACYAPAWRDTLNRPVRNWKLKFRQVWARRAVRRPPARRGTAAVGNWEL